MTTRAPMVLSIVDARTKVAHLVDSETVSRHRRSGRYPAKCGQHVLAASLTTAPDTDCKRCHHHSQESSSDE